MVCKRYKKINLKIQMLPYSKIKLQAFRSAGMRPRKRKNQACDTGDHRRVDTAKLTHHDEEREPSELVIMLKE